MVENRLFQFGKEMEAATTILGSSTVIPSSSTQSTVASSSLVIIEGNDDGTTTTTTTNTSSSSSDTGSRRNSLSESSPARDVLVYKKISGSKTSGDINGYKMMNFLKVNEPQPYHSLKNKNPPGGLNLLHHSKTLSLGAERRTRSVTTSSSSESSTTPSGSGSYISHRNGNYQFPNNRIGGRYNNHNGNNNGNQRALHHSNNFNRPHYNNNRGSYNSNHNNGVNSSLRTSSSLHADSVTFELDGQIKYKLKDPLVMPDFLFKTMSQVLKFHGHPWVPDHQDYVNNFSDVYEGLSAELEAFYQYMKPRPEEEVIRRATYFAILKSIKKIDRFNIDAVKFYGSFSSGTYLPVSDIDIVVYCRNDQVIQILSWIATRLFADGIINTSCQIITHSRIPLLKFYDSFTGFPINITVNTPHVRDRAEFIKLSIRPETYQIKILYFLKFYLLQKNHNQVFHGGIGSYALSLMVIRYFQTNATKDITMGPRTSLLARLLIGFLNFYGDTEFIRKHVISVTDGGRFYPVSQFSSYQHNSNSHQFYGQGEPKRASILTIEDHMDPHKNVSVGSYKSEAILSGFKVLADQLTTISNRDRPSRMPGGGKSIINNVMSVVDSFDSYRSIIRLQFEYYFSDSKFGPSGYIHYDYDEFIYNRNTFGKRELLFSFEKMDDTSFETRLIGRLPWACHQLNDGVNGDLYPMPLVDYGTINGAQQPYDYCDFFYDYPDYDQEVTTASDIFFQTLSQAIITARQEDMSKSRLQHIDYSNHAGHFGGGAGGSMGGGSGHHNYHHNGGNYRNGGTNGGWYGNSSMRSYNNHHNNNNGYHTNNNTSTFPRQNRYNNGQYNSQLNGYYSSGRNSSSSSTLGGRRIEQAIRNLELVDKPIKRKLTKKKPIVAYNNNDESCPNMENGVIAADGGTGGAGGGDGGGGQEELSTPVTSEAIQRNGGAIRKASIVLRNRTLSESQNGTTTKTEANGNLEKMLADRSETREHGENETSTTSTTLTSSTSSISTPSLSSSPMAAAGKSKKLIKSSSRPTTPAATITAAVSAEERSEPKTATNVLKEMLKIPTLVASTSVSNDVPASN